MLGCFEDKDRISFLKEIETKNECSFEHPGAQKFLNSFVFGNPDFKNIDKSGIKTITIHAIGYGPESSENATIISGYLILKNFEGKVTRKICSMEELREWTKQTPFWKWFAWSILAVSVLLGTIVFILELKKT